MQRHAEEGARIIDRLGFLGDAVPAIRHHHERWDGAGYPDGLAGEEIPLGARIIHVAGALDSMFTNRVYRAARPAGEALDELRPRRRQPVLPPDGRGARAPPRRARRPARRAASSRSPRRVPRLLRGRATCTSSSVLAHFGRADVTRTAPSRSRHRGAPGRRRRYTDAELLLELQAVRRRGASSGRIPRRPPTRRRSSAGSGAGTPPSGAPASYRAASLPARSCWGGCARSERSSVARPPGATSMCGAAGCRPGRSSGRPSARSRERSAQPGSTSPAGTNGSSARSSRASGSRGGWAACRGSPTGGGRGAAARACPRNGR